MERFHGEQKLGELLKWNVVAGQPSGAAGAKERVYVDSEYQGLAVVRERPNAVPQLEGVLAAAMVTCLRSAIC